METVPSYTDLVMNSILYEYSQRYVTCIFIQVLVSVYGNSGNDVELIVNVANFQLTWITADNGINNNICM